jgi:hypothetical protein
MRKTRSAHKMQLVSPSGRELAARKCSSEDNIKMANKERGCEGVDWTELSTVQWNAPVNVAMNLRFHKNVESS